MSTVTGRPSTSCTAPTDQGAQAWEPGRTRPAPKPRGQRLRRHDQPVPTSRREHPAERREQGAIGCSKRRPWLLPPEHRELMVKNEQFDILGELAASAAHEQPQQRREREIRERKEHPPMLPKLAPAYIENRYLVLEPLTMTSSLSALQAPSAA